MEENKNQVESVQVSKEPEKIINNKDYSANKQQNNNPINNNTEVLQEVSLFIYKITY